MTSSGLGPTLWRVTWALHRRRAGRCRPSWVAVTAARRPPGGGRRADSPAVLLLVAFGAPDLGRGHDHDLAPPAPLAARPDSPRGGGLAGPAGDPPGTVLAPDGLSITVAVTTTGREDGGAPRLLPRLPARRPRLPLRRPARSCPRFANADPAATTPEVAPARTGSASGRPVVYRRDDAGARVLPLPATIGVSCPGPTAASAAEATGRDQGPVTGMSPWLFGHSLGNG